MIEIIKFYGDWCQPCKQLDKILEGQEYTKIDVEDNIELSAKMGIKQLPTMLFKKDGEIKAKHVGLMTLEQFLEYKNLCL